MLVIRCPQCDLPAMEAELVNGNCPACGAHVPHAAPPPEVKKPTPAPVVTGPIGWLALSFATLFVGGIGGYVAGVISVDAPSGASVERALTAEPSSNSERLATLESMNARLRKELDAQRKQTAAAQALVEAAPTEERVKELESLTMALGQDVEKEKKRAATAEVRAETAERAAIAAKAQLETPPLLRIKELDLVTKKLLKEIEIRGKLIKDANVREEAARKNTEVVRAQMQKTIEQVQQTGQKSLEKLRLDDQRAMEKLRVDHQKAIDAVQKQLRQQEQMTQLARAEAQRQKLAADEAKKKQK